MRPLPRSTLFLFVAAWFVAAQSPNSTGPTFKIDNSQLPRVPVLIFYGDTRFTGWAFPSDVTIPWARRALIEKIASEKPDALFINGDIPYQGGHAADYKVFEQETAIWRNEHLRTFPVLGNHEFYMLDYFSNRERGLANWWATFPSLKRLEWYSVQFGGEVYALCLDSNFGALKPGGTQRAWIDHQLAALPDSVQYLFFVLHHSPSGDYLEGHGGKHNPEFTAEDLQSYFERKQQSTRARFIVVSGHVHNYGRFGHNGVMYIVSGGGGAHPVFFRRMPDDEFKGKDLTQAGRPLPNFHYVKFELGHGELKAAMMRISNPQARPPSPKWEIADRFSISAPAR